MIRTDDGATILTKKEWESLSAGSTYGEGSKDRVQALADLVTDALGACGGDGSGDLDTQEWGAVVAALDPLLLVDLITGYAMCIERGKTLRTLRGS